MSDNNVVISCRNIWKIFGSNAAQMIEDESTTIKVKYKSTERI